MQKHEQIAIAAYHLSVHLNWYSEMEGYKIGAVSNLTRIAPNTIRVWERRYQAVTPQRGERGSRVYTLSDINRLKTLQNCIQLGDSIGQIAQLSEADLTDRLKQLQEQYSTDTPATDTSPTTELRRLLVAGSSLPTRTRLLNLQQFAECQYFATFDKLVSSVESDPQAIRKATAKSSRHPDAKQSSTPCNDDLICITEHDSLSRDLCEQLVTFVNDNKPAVMIVCYGFGMSAHVEQLQSAGILLLREPADNNSLLTLLHAPKIVRTPVQEASVSNDGNVPSLRFSKRQLLSLSRIRSNITCECPQHIAELLVSLNAFERYSAMCEDSNEDDAILHAMLRKATAHSRLTMENALAELLEAENIQLPNI